MNAHKLLITLALSFVAFTGYSETLDALMQRLLTSDTIKAYGAEQPVGVAQTITTTAGPVSLNEVRVPVVVTVNAAGDRKLSYVLVLVEQYNDPQESAYLTGGGAANYVAATPTAGIVERAKAALDAALGADAWSFVDVAGQDDAKVAKIKIKATGETKVFAFAADGSLLSADAE